VLVLAWVAVLALAWVPGLALAWVAVLALVWAAVLVRDTLDVGRTTQQIGTEAETAQG